MNIHLGAVSEHKQLALDIKDSVGRWPLWINLGWEDVLRQYRRSFLGPVWITLNTLIFIGAFGVIGAQLFKMDVKDYLPYFAAGHVIFMFMSAAINEGCQSYISTAALLKQTRTPKFAMALRVVLRNLIMFAHNLPVLLLVIILYGSMSSIRILQLLGAIILLSIWLSLVCAILGVLSARFRDIPMIVSSLMQIAFFLTPVMWKPTQLPGTAQLLVDYNPLSSFLDLVRAALLNADIIPSSWKTSTVSVLVTAVVFWAVMVHARRKIAYWI